MRRLFALCLGLLLGWSDAQAAGQRFLVSIAPPPLVAGEYISHFEINVDGASILSACHIPFGWRVTAGMYDSNSGVLSGDGGLGGSMIGKENRNLDQLNNLFLIELNSGEAHPIVAGKIDIGKYGARYDPKSRTVRSTRHQLVLVPAERCPATR